jgi:hypothetical protein
MKQEEVKQWNKYLDAKNQIRRRKFVLSAGMYGIPSMKNRGQYLDLYDVELRYKFGGNKAIHKYIKYDCR